MRRLPTLIGGKAANVGFNDLERGYANQRLAGDRRRRLHVDLVELPPHVAPTDPTRTP
jgi:hypothetical protein